MTHGAASSMETSFCFCSQVSLPLSLRVDALAAVQAICCFLFGINHGPVWAVVTRGVVIHDDVSLVGIEWGGLADNISEDRDAHEVCSRHPHGFKKVAAATTSAAGRIPVALKNLPRLDHSVAAIDDAYFCANTQAGVRSVDAPGATFVKVSLGVGLRKCAVLWVFRGRYQKRTSDGVARFREGGTYGTDAHQQQGGPCHESHDSLNCVPLF